MRYRHQQHLALSAFCLSGVSGISKSRSGRSDEAEVTAAAFEMAEEVAAAAEAHATAVADGVEIPSFFVSTKEKHLGESIQKLEPSNKQTNKPGF